jgi:uncharacterized protein YjbJ (UPF0337 family)
MLKDEEEGSMTNATEEAGQEEGLAGQASAKVQDAATVVQEKASELREQGSVRLRDQFDERSTQAGAQVRSLAEALRRSGDDLRNEGNGSAAQLTGQIADRIERIGDYLEQKSGGELMRDVETFARRRPWMLAGIGMLAGVAGARFVKASSEQRYDTHRQWPHRAAAASSAGNGSIDQPGGVGSDLPGALSDEPLARDPYAGRS